MSIYAGYVIYWWIVSSCLLSWVIIFLLVICSYIDGFNYNYVHYENDLIYTHYSHWYSYFTTIHCKTFLSAGTSSFDLNLPLSVRIGRISSVSFSQLVHVASRFEFDEKTQNYKTSGINMSSVTWAHFVKIMYKLLCWIM